MGEVRLLHSPLFDTIMDPNWSKTHGSEKPRKPVDVVQMASYCIQHKIQRTYHDTYSPPVSPHHSFPSLAFLSFPIHAILCTTYFVFALLCTHT